MAKIKDLKIGFLGFGNMAQAIARGWLKTETLESGQLYASARNQENLKKNIADLGIHACKSNADLVAKADWIILSVKPHQVDEVVKDLKDDLQDKVIVSVAVGIHYADLETVLADGTQHVSILPNTPIAIGQGAVSLESRHSLSDESYDLFLELFQAIAVIAKVTTEQMGVAGVLNGCGPAFVAIFIEAMADAAVKYGLSRQEAYQLASQTVQGTGQLQLETGDHPAVMKDAVTSPGGTTIKGVSALEENGFRSAVIQAFDAILEKK